MVLRMEMRWAEKRGFETELLEASAGEEAGIKSATFRVDGENAYGLYGAEKGVHRLVRISPFDSASRRQTSFAGVEVAPVVEGDGEIEIADDDLQVDTYRASGAGGQHVNKTDSAVRITHRPTRHRRAVPERALAVLQQGDGDGDAAGEARRARGARAPGGDRAREGGGPGRQLRLADPLLRAAPLHARQGPAHEPRDRRRAARARRRPRPVRARVPALEAPSERALRARRPRARGGRRERRRDGAGVRPGARAGARDRDPEGAGRDLRARAGAARLPRPRSGRDGRGGRAGGPVAGGRDASCSSSRATAARCLPPSARR